MRHENTKEPIFLLSVIAAVFPIVAVILSVFDRTEPYRYLVFATYLMEGSLLGSVFGVIALIGNRKAKSVKIYILSLIPVVILILSVLGDAIVSRNMP